MTPERQQRPGRRGAAGTIVTPLNVGQNATAQLSLSTSPGVRLGDPDTSRAAADMAGEWRSKLKRRVYAILLERGARGATDDEVHELLPDELLGAIAKRRGSLVADGLVNDSRRRRPTRRGCPAVVWVATDDRGAVTAG